MQVMFFNDEAETPLAFPMTGSQMLHQTAQYNYNPNNGYSRFLWMRIKNKNASPPTFNTTEATIWPGYAE